MKMMFSSFDRHAALRQIHGDRISEAACGYCLRPGWNQLVEGMLDQCARDFPAVRFPQLVALRGWLRVEMECRPFDPLIDARLGKVVQGFVTQSLATCEECGSHHGRHVDARLYGCGRAMDRTLCGDCVPVFAALVKSVRGKENCCED